MTGWSGGWPGDTLKGLETHGVGRVMDSVEYEAGRNVHWYMGNAREQVVSYVCGCYRYSRGSEGIGRDPSLSDELVDEGVGAKVGEAGVSTLATKKWRVEEPMPRGLLSVVPNHAHWARPCDTGLHTRP